jgi:hypothetical protein
MEAGADPRSRVEILADLRAIARAAGVAEEPIDDEVLMPWLEEMEAKAVRLRRVDFGTVWQTAPAFTQCLPGEAGRPIAKTSG